MTHEEGITKVAELIKGVHVCSFTTIGDMGELQSRPMGIQEVEFDGDLWFFAYSDSRKAQQIAANPEVNIAVNKGNNWVSLSGQAEIVHDPAKAKELWNTMVQAWFPDGLDTPGLCLIKVHGITAEYWDSHSTKAIYLLKAVTAAVTGTQPDAGENKTVEL